MLIWASCSFSSRQKEAEQGLRKKMTRCWQMRLSLPEQWDNALFIETRKEEKTKQGLNLEEYKRLQSILWFIKECLRWHFARMDLLYMHMCFSWQENLKNRIPVPWCLLGEYASFYIYSCFLEMLVQQMGFALKVTCRTLVKEQSCDIMMKSIKNHISHIMCVMIPHNLIFLLVVIEFYLNSLNSQWASANVE